MAAETQTLNFGPEWLRALSSGGSVTSPPPSPALPKYKLVDYRYGREEMLALYEKHNRVPTELRDKEFEPIVEEEPLPPLALVPFTEEEQRNFSISVNSLAVLRLAGRGGGTVVGAVRGRSSSRGRGRGRGEFYQRSFDEVDGGFGRNGKEMHRSQSWEERGDRRFDKARSREPGRVGFEDNGTVAGKKHEYIRSESENWRLTRDEQNGEDEDGSRRIAASRRQEGEKWRPSSPGTETNGPRSAGWREGVDRRRRFDFEFRERDEEKASNRTNSGSVDDDRECLPEWCLEDSGREMGTFDSSGAFLSLKKSSKEPIPEEQEMEFRAVEEQAELQESGNPHEECGNHSPAVIKKTEVRETAAENDEQTVLSEKKTVSESLPAPMEPPLPENVTAPLLVRKKEEVEKALPEPVGIPKPVESKPEPNMVQSKPEVREVTVKTSAILAEMANVATAAENSTQRSTTVVAVPQENKSTFADDDDEGLKRLEREMNQEAEKMVAYLQDNALDDELLMRKIQEHNVKELLVLQNQDSLQKWFYKDPQGEIQGPFSNKEMADWYTAGYFPQSLLVKRVGGDRFQPLRDIIQMLGRNPFVAGFGPPAIRVLDEVEKEQLKRQQELATLLQIQHLHYQQVLLSTGAASNQKKRKMSDIPLLCTVSLSQQYQQLLAQQQQKTAMTAGQQQQLALLLQQYQALKSRSARSCRHEVHNENKVELVTQRSSEQAVISPVTRSMSVPDTGSVWEVPTTLSQPAGWEGGSVWDLPVEPSTNQAMEHVQQLEKAKAAKLEQERREAERRVKKEEEERKLQEEMRQKQQKEELKRREEELAHRKQEEARKRQLEQEAALRLQREEEERKKQEERRKQEETLRCLEESRREAEERQRKEELQRKQEEEAALKWAQEEAEAQRRREEEALAAKLHQEEEERKRKEQERQKELLRQRQQEALRKLQQQQMAQMKLPSSSTWGHSAAAAVAPVCQQSQNALSLAEIQKLEEEGERLQREEQQRHQKELMKVLQQQQQQQKLFGWASVPKNPICTKSLLEIQQEEARQMQQQQPHRTHSNLLNNSGHPVWQSVNTSPTNHWSSDMSSIWGAADTKNANLGFWDDAIKEVIPPTSSAKINKSTVNLRTQGLTVKQNKKAEEEKEKVKRLFQEMTKAKDDFTQWCEQMLSVLSSPNDLDVPTFVALLKEVESPYEVHDYVRIYLGDTPDTKEFAKQFLERRAKQKTSQPCQQQRVPLQSCTESVQPGKKKKKQKMVKADPRLLGFSVNASSERLNMGEIQTLED
ncbi:GRB10-interacting GYF protein 2 isoform X3 [Protopterus annectens]|uniref:GRB10-interacting GYF protein 2 isoform X3 n=1 Tax=Protopterus annectens TaxID=7888 RepID=UPI001CF9F817|nr:GRB10-interacting GYF protein 2 isoform X3 [Protopterus annectens]